MGAYTVIIRATDQFIHGHKPEKDEMYPPDFHLKANHCYKSITERLYAPFKPDFDYIIDVNLEWPADRHVDVILSQYLFRQKQVNEYAGIL